LNPSRTCATGCFSEAAARAAKRANAFSCGFGRVRESGFGDSSAGGCPLRPLNMDVADRFLEVIGGLLPTMNFSAVDDVYRRYLEVPIAAEIAPDDEMYQSGKDWYVEVGISALRCVLHGLAISKLLRVSSILDLPCGHGRVARHLRAAFPEASMSFSDLNRSAVDFCASRFGGAGVYSEPDLPRVIFPMRYDLIWVGSLFTHLDLYRTKTFLKHLVGYLAPDGILVASFHGRWSIEVQNHYGPLIDSDRWKRVLSEYKETGYGYSPYSDTTDHSYGISLVRPSRVVELVCGVEGIRLLAYTERGWADNHDTLVVGKTDRLEAWPSGAGV
jgi:SAM-dependent methyltransferase